MASSIRGLICRTSCLSNASSRARSRSMSMGSEIEQVPSPGMLQRSSSASPCLPSSGEGAVYILRGSPHQTPTTPLRPCGFDRKDSPIVSGVGK